MKRFISMLLLIILSLCSSMAAARVVFDDEFSPLQGMTSSYENPYRQEICLNGLWEYQGVKVPVGWQRDAGKAPELAKPLPDAWDAVKIKIPSPWNVNSYRRSDGPDHHDFPSYPAAWENDEMGWLRKKVKIPADWDGKQMVLHFEAVAGFTEVFVEGHKVCENFDIFLPFEADITEYAKPDTDIEILVGVRKASLFDDNRTIGRRVIPAGSMWGQHIAGIWQDVYLFALPKVRIQDVYVQPLVDKGLLDLELTLQNDTDKSKSVSIDGQVKKWGNLAGKTVLSAPVPKWKLGSKVLPIPAGQVEVPAKSTATVKIAVPAKDKLEHWTPVAPNLYGLVLDVQESGKKIDCKYQRFGWRQWTFDGSKQCLNGKPMELHGDSWHFQGIPQMTRRYAHAWYSAIKDANGNAVRLHAQVFPRFYMEMADEMGICVLAETSNWASDGGPKFDDEVFWKNSDDHLKRLVLRDRNYPSVFGWSLTNENRPIIMHVFNRPDLMPVQVKAWERWVAMCRELDPTRPWISGDGDDDGEGTLPTVVGHYGDENGMKNWASRGKPWGVGEHSMAYYGTPEQVSKYNGQRAYESQLGRMEGLAYECYDLIAMQRRHNASYTSVFNIAWYALKPLPLGLADTTRPPTLEDGVFLTRPYVEGKPGVQPERIGPYGTTFNPGYDSSLPLYDTWPMFDAIKAANAPGGPAPSEWSRKPVEKEEKPAAPRQTYASVTFMGANDSRLLTRLSARGVNFSDRITEPENSMVFVDGTCAINAQQAAELKDVLAKGGDILIWGITPQTQGAFNQLLPAAVVVTERKATSLLVKSNAQPASGLKHSDFYFCEIQTTPVMEYGLAGDFVSNGQVVLAACDTNWLRWNKADECTKTASVLRSEREAKPSGAAFVVGKAGKGQVLINTMTEFYQTDMGMKTLTAMFKNMGIPMRTMEMDAGAGIFDLDGNLKKALVCGSFGAESVAAAFDTDFLDGETTVKPLQGDTVHGKTWKMGSVSGSLDFKFNEMGLDGPMDNAAVYVSFWLWSPRPLDNLLLEPDMPKLDLIGGADDGYKVWLNGSLLAQNNRTGPMVMGMIECKALAMKQGWNHFLVKVVQGGGGWQFAARLNCSDYKYMAQLKAAAENPDQK